MSCNEGICIKSPERTNQITHWPICAHIEKGHTKHWSILLDRKSKKNLLTYKELWNSQHAKNSNKEEVYMNGTFCSSTLGPMTCDKYRKCKWWNYNNKILVVHFLTYGKMLCIRSSNIGIRSLSVGAHCTEPRTHLRHYCTNSINLSHLVTCDRHNDILVSSHHWGWCDCQKISSECPCL